MASDDERGIDAYAASGGYNVAGAPVQISESRLPESLRTGDVIFDLGLLMNSAIADQVAASRVSS